MSGTAHALAQLRQALASGAINQATYDIAAAALAQAPAGAGAIAQGPGATALGQGAAQVQGDNHGTINLGVIIEQARQPGASAEVLQQAYLARLLRELNQLPLLAGEQGGEQVQLACVYTALMTLRSDHDGRVSQPDQQRDMQFGFKPEAKPLSALAVLNAESRLVLMAGPGGGKSTFVNVLAMALAGERLEMPQPNLATLTAPLPEEDDHAFRHQSDQAPEPQPWHHGPLLPVLVVLRDLAAQLPPPGTPVDAETVWTFIAGQLKRRALEAYAPHLHQQLLQHGGLVMFDGLDEVPDAQQRRAQVKQAVQAFAATFHRCRLLVTSRTYAYQHQAWKLDGFAEVQLRPFSQAQMAAFIDAWYGHMANLARLTEADARDRANTLKSEIQRNPRLQELAERPLLLTLIAQLQTKGGGSLPQRREALYDAAVTMLLDTWEKLKPRTAPDGSPYQEPSLSEFLQVGVDQIRRQLNRLAFEVHRDQRDLTGSADIPQERLIAALMAAAPHNPDVKVTRLQEYLRDRAGILNEHGVGQLQFPHRSFQEYLAACHLTDDNFPDQLANLARTDPDRWREVAMLAGAKAARGSESAAWLLAETLCPEPVPQALGKPHAAAAWGARLAGQVLAESARLTDVAPRDEPKRTRIADWQLALMRQPFLSAVERAAAGRHLADLGDPRPGVTTLAGMPFVWVPTGTFWMGEDEQGDASPCHRVDLPYGYAIARYPVSAAQWREYLVASGSSGTNGQRGNEPVALVSWHEAQAFCHWLTDHMRTHLPPGWAVMLPSEAEWEKAARGGEELPLAPRTCTLVEAAQDLVDLSQGAAVANVQPRRAYPWGDVFDAERANVQSALGGPSALGIFPDGASPYGCEEMAGNVWEWTRSLWGKERFKPSFGYPYRPDDARRERVDAPGGMLRVVRGGSWLSPRVNARCAYRFRNEPDDRFINLGFRVVLRSSPVVRAPARRKR